MAYLTDMEELLSSIESTSIRDYMREALNCYTSSTYRGCIVLSYIALFDDVLSKLGELGKVNSTAKTVYNDALKKKLDQEVFESYLIDQLSSKKLMSELDVTFLDTLRNLRNKSAHPSGHKPSAEEARFIFFEVISRFLSKPILSTTSLIDDIIARFSNSNFFPNNIGTDIKEVVEEEIASLHDEAIPQLVAKIAEALISSDVAVKANASYFLNGLASLDQAKIIKEIQIRVLQAKSDNPNYSKAILRLLTANGKLIIGVSKACLSRIKKILSERIEDVKGSYRESLYSHPTAVFVSLLKELDDSRVLAQFEDELTKLFGKLPYSEYLLSALDNHPKTFNLYFSIVIKKAGSSTFEVASEFVQAMGKLDKKLSEHLSDKQAFFLVVAVLKTAEWGTFAAQGVRSTKFAESPYIRTKAAKFAKDNKSIIEQLIKNKLSLDMTNVEFISEYLDPS